MYAYLFSVRGGRAGARAGRGTARLAPYRPCNGVHPESRSERGSRACHVTVTSFARLQKAILGHSSLKSCCAQRAAPRVDSVENSAPCLPLEAGTFRPPCARGLKIEVSRKRPPPSWPHSVWCLEALATPSCRRLHQLEPRLPVSVRLVWCRASPQCSTH